MKIINIYLSFIIVNIKRLLEYKVDFVFNMIAIIVWLSTGLINISIIFTTLDTFNGWDLSQMGLLYGMWSLTFSIYNAFGNGILDIEKNIITGKMDTLLTKPVSPLLQIICSKISTMGLGLLFFGITIVIISASKVNIEWNVFKIIYIIITSFTGGILIFSTYLILGSLAFWFIRSKSAIRVGYDIHTFSQYPIDIYSKNIKFILIGVLPYAFTNYFPVAFILGKVGIFYGVLSPIISIIIFFISIKIWNLGLKNYEGTGS
jgi:ABC-2 type transport system permease protein